MGTPSMRSFHPSSAVLATSRSPVPGTAPEADVGPEDERNAGFDPVRSSATAWSARVRSPSRGTRTERAGIQAALR